MLRRKKTKIPSPRTYFPATGWDWLLPIYDPLAKLLGGDSVRRELVDRLSLAPGHRVLDIGCGTGSQAVLIKEHHPGVAVRARRKRQRSVKCAAC